VTLSEGITYNSKHMRIRISYCKQGRLTQCWGTTVYSECEPSI